jgi:hypothetical protein
MINKINGQTYELTNLPKEGSDLCQVYDKTTNEVMLMRYSELEFLKLHEMRERFKSLKEEGEEHFRVGA